MTKGRGSGLVVPQGGIAAPPDEPKARQRPPWVDGRHHPPSHALVIQPQMAPDMWLVVPDMPALAPQAQGNGGLLEFKLGDGYLIGMRGSVVELQVGGVSTAGPELDAAVGLQMAVNGREEKMSNGATADWMWYSDLFVEGVQWTPMLLYVRSTDVMHTTFFSRLLADGKTLTPSLSFGWREKREPAEFVLPEDED